MPRERIVLCPRSENFWQAGPTGPCGPCSELYLDRGVEFGRADDLPGGENERFLEYWNLVFMQFDQDPIGDADAAAGARTSTRAWASTAWRSSSRACRRSSRPTSSRRSWRSGGSSGRTREDRRAGAAHPGRPLARDDVPHRPTASCRPTRTAGTSCAGSCAARSSRASRIGIERRLPAALRRPRGRDDGRARTPSCAQQRDDDPQVGAARRRSRFGRTLEQGTQAARRPARRAAGGGLGAEDAFRLHDTYGFPIELTRELAAERGVPFGGEDEFERLMERAARALARGAGAARGAADASRAPSVAGPPTRFTGYETLEQRTTVAAIAEADGRSLVKLAESPFYAEGGGQVSDAGAIECEDGDCRARVVDVVRAGDDQALVVERRARHAGAGRARAWPSVDRAARHATMANHTATHLLHAALRERLGDHVRQAGSYVGPDKLRFDFTHGRACQRRGAPRRRGPGQRAGSLAQRPGAADHDDARRGASAGRDGAVRREVRRRRADGRDRRRLVLARALRRHARALDGGDRRSSRSARRARAPSNVRRIEAITGPEAVRLLREHDAMLRAAARRAAHAARARGRGGGRAAGARAPGGQGGRRRRRGTDAGRARASGRAGRRRDGPHRGRAGARRPGAARRSPTA